MTKFATATGLLFDYTRPDDLDQYKMEDIAHHLARIQRFNGGVPMGKSYSVGEHCINLVRGMEAEQYGTNALKIALLHDASETYLGDLVSGLKELLPDYKELEQRIQSAILCKFCNCDFIPAYVKQRDEAILVDEIGALFDDHLYDGYVPEVDPLCIDIRHSFHPSTVKQCFLMLWEDLEKRGQE